MRISVIIPTYNEAGVIGRTLEQLRTSLNTNDEVLVVDGGSSDATVAEAIACGITPIAASTKGRAAQLNQGAAGATGDVLYFLHADSQLPADWRQQIAQAVASGAGCGCMRMRFDRSHWALRAKAWFTRFRASGLHYGDQSLFVRREHFEAVGGYRADMTVFEDLDIIERLRKVCRFDVLPGPIITSARKYDRNSLLSMQLTFYIMYPLYRLGVGQPTLTALYKRLVRQDKI